MTSPIATGSSRSSRSKLVRNLIGRVLAQWLCFSACGCAGHGRAGIDDKDACAKVRRLLDVWGIELGARERTWTANNSVIERSLQNSRHSIIDKGVWRHWQSNLSQQKSTLPQCMLSCDRHCSQVLWDCELCFQALMLFIFRCWLMIFSILWIPLRILTLLDIV